MNWIKENKFLAGLLGGTLLAAVLLYLFGSRGSTKYAEAKDAFDQAAAEVSQAERLPVYPKPENRDSKAKAIDEYRKSLAELQGAFGKFRPEAIENTTPQQFTDQLIKADKETRQAFEQAGTTVPDAYFCGFERYKTELARGSATGILSYELGLIRNLMLELAKSGVGELKNLHRPALAEENGGTYEPAPSDVARALPLEITFSGTEDSVRAFFTSLASTENHFAVIRSLRISNSKRGVPPKAGDAKFDKPAAAESTAGAASDVFSGDFVLPTEEEEPAEAAAEGEEAETPAEEDPAPAPQPEADPGDTSRILQQVLGSEDVQVFLHLDLMQFLPAKELP